MAVKAVDLEAELIETVCERVRQRIPEDRARAAEAFVRQYYRWVPAEDLADRSPLDLYGAAIAHWNLCQERREGEAKVRVYNPAVEQEGWQSPYTVVEIVSDDMPFIVDSVTMELGRHGHAIDLVIHPMMRIYRDGEGRLQEVLEPGAPAQHASRESVLHVEVAREPDPAQLARLRENVERVLQEVRIAVQDWSAMRARTGELADELGAHPPAIEDGELAEVREFLAWLAADHFTFLGYREYELVHEDGESGLKAIAESGLGFLRRAPARSYTPLNPKAVELARFPHPLVLTKANSRSTIHRPSYLDYVGVKRFDADGRVTGERRFLGLYTTAAYKADAREIPLLRGKIARVLERAGFPPDSHDAKALLEIVESYPRDSLFQITPDELFDIAMGILGLGERQRVRLFVRRDQLDRFVACLACIPRDRFNTENRERVGKILLEAFGGSYLDWNLQLSESLLARVHYIVYCPEGVPADYDVAEIEARMVSATRAWSDDLREALVEQHGEEEGTRAFRRYGAAFPPSYRSDWVGRAAVSDIEHVEELESSHESVLRLYRPLEAGDGTVRAKLYSDGDVLLSDVLPTFENMGAKVIDERPYEVRPKDRDPVWIYDFGLQMGADEVEPVRERFQEAFLSVRRGELEDDGLGALVLAAGLSGRQVVVVRTLARYLRQAGVSFSDAYVERTLVARAGIVKSLVELFETRFDPDARERPGGRQLKEKIEAEIDAVESLDEDRILRSFLTLTEAVLRTNYYCRDGDGRPRPYVSLKLDPHQLPWLPVPRPRFEIFVYSPRVEGVHLRGGKVARGGLRWSDRREDFRTEILGLMKAQMVKNALIVPVGSKGGFVVKRPPADGGREALQQEATECYRHFLRGLLDLTDNIVEGEVVGPERVVRYDEEDPYLVVAADKGTASFSDIANEISAEYAYWLGDAFASGGSHGYDHKQMGITARGAWESVERHFRELGQNAQAEDFTVAGIGDMSGDVFGNGMLLSRHIRLVAAFNHLHVFLDPSPDPEASFRERQRLFEQPQSSWGDYERSLISDGGGIYERSAKSIEISEQAREALGIEEQRLSPQELIRAILCAPVDLLWNGGIGSYVKASSESHGEVGDKANDAVRVDGRNLRCRVVGEGGNLGLTQRGRIEYARRGGPQQEGGRVNTDAIDNVAGVNCSDHEVNIKILLDALVRAGDLSQDERNGLLQEMTDAVAEQVLYGSYTQTQAMSIALAQAKSMVDVHARLIRYLEQVAELDRVVEFLPSEDELHERGAEGDGLVAPELAVAMAYIKIHLYARLLDSDLPEDDYLGHDLERYFPAPLPARYREQMGSHRLRREIIATVVANQLVDRAGTTFAFRLHEETGAAASRIARGYATAREVLDMRSFWDEVEGLDDQVAADVQLKMLIEGRRLVERATRWLLRACLEPIAIEATVERYRLGAQELAEALPDVLEGAAKETFDAQAGELQNAGVPEGLARRVARMPSMLALFDIVEVSQASSREQSVVTETYFRLATRLELVWVRDRIIELPRANRWQALARAALRDELYSLHRALTQEVLESAAPDASPEAAISEWGERCTEAIERALGVLVDIRASRSYDTTTLPVALRELRNLVSGAAPVLR